VATAVIHKAARVRHEQAIESLVSRLLAWRAGPGHWEGRLASSALSTGTAVLALDLVARHDAGSAGALAPLVRAGVGWLTANQHHDGGWGDTIRSRSNISTTAIVWATLSAVAPVEAAAAISRAEVWLTTAAGGLAPEQLRLAILRRYGKDKTFSVPILTVLALTGRLGPGAAAWRRMPQLPFELAAMPHRWFHRLRLPVVSYALPALIAIGQVRHHFAPSRNPATRLLRARVRQRTHRVLHEMQPESGGYLEATPLTSFVVMSLAGMEWADSPVVRAGVRFLVDSMRDDGSWPIDTNLATWGTTLSISALDEAASLAPALREDALKWLLAQQTAREHPFTHAAPGGWAWTPLSGGVPDADDTSSALIALRRIGVVDGRTVEAAAGGARWLLGLQNRDGGVPTFCRGWGVLPFDRSTPEITAHALRAWSAWLPVFEPTLQGQLRRAAARASRFLSRAQRSDGSWIPLWFGNEHTPDENNPVYGTARVVSGLQAPLLRADSRAAACRRRGIAWLTSVQNADGGWGGAKGVVSSIEETGVVLTALAAEAMTTDDAHLSHAVEGGARWLVTRLKGDLPLPAPVGLYFARLWYFEELYPLVFPLEGLACAARALGRSSTSSSPRIAAGQ
jgi:squalene-hopene/tetraprenyl-beta-curcumene cyclase